ncbi:alpha/beta fold hydrolase [Lacinutrix iliipiscaria]|uniref:Alpha/beta fold hydrolase n=1 Tax=Lacinutrix iliipiscaria TaxID=1230532 RepID=A0ABW5WMM5_9FLAO
MRAFFILILLIFCLSCSDVYDKYKNEPDYITHAKASDKSYFEAYDKTLKLWNTSFEELYVPTTNGIAHVIVSGPKDGDPVVLLHGMNASSTMWYPNVEALTKTHRIYAIDFILEPGKSYLYNDIENVDAITEWYKEVFFALELNRFHIIGASRGGWLAVKIALNNQNSIKSLVLLSPAQTFTWVKPSTDLFKNIITLLSSKEKQMEQTLESMSSDVDNINKAYLEQYSIATEKDSVNKFIINMKPFSSNELKSLTLPVLVLIGDDDMINTKRTVDLAKRLLPNVKAETINNAGHFLSIDQAEIINQKTIDFLNMNK